ncbi:hypothetical protein BB559_002303 [Furculomyces boomerangus]|uniref:Replication factor C subunit 3 n=2 Tax=Harpellales TaxID=61421 RepID=A0A2T9YWH9_9FUNG|nr:hypothetical protein BB559_002303 [Furculomyces boomerangus]PWA02880.1 hypothetical protein BB558_000975 [Smittium angustum]
MHEAMDVDKTQNNALMWVEKYRPEKLEDLVSQNNIVETIQKYIEQGSLPHLLFYGPPGTGKTSTILAIAKQLYGKHTRNMVQELNASDDRGIDVVREQIKNFASTTSVFGMGFKLVILDEADSMTQAAQAALRRVIEKYTKNVRFCIICNYASKIIPAVQSRCTKFRFSPLQIDQIRSRLNYVIENENVNVTEDGKEAILKLSGGDMRRVLNVLQGCHLAYETIDKEAVYSCTGQPRPEDIRLILDSMSNDEFSTCVEYITGLKTARGLALSDIISLLSELILDINYPNKAKIHIMEKVAEIEYRLCNGSNEKIQLSALVSAFKLGLDMAV